MYIFYYFINCNKLILKNFPGQTYIVVPRRFYEHAGTEINDHVQLEDPVGNTFNVSYYHNNGEHRMGAGLFQLRSVHNIQTNVVIHFLYVGHARFSIRIYDTLNNEITYRVAPEGPPQVNPNIDAGNDNDVLNVSSDDEADVEVQAVPWMQKIWQSIITSAHIHRNQPMVFLSFNV